MKLKKIRNALLVVLTLALVSATAVAVTWAANGTFTAVDNEFENADITVKISEYHWDGEPSTYTEAGEENEDPLLTTGLGNVMAQQYDQTTPIPKDPVLENTSANEPEYVAMSALFKVTWKEGGTSSTHYLTYSQFTTNIATLRNSGGSAGINSVWTPYTVTNTALTKTVDYFVYIGNNGVLAKTTKASAPLFNSVLVDKPVLVTAENVNGFTDLNTDEKKAAALGKYRLPNVVDNVQYIDDLPTFDIVLTGFAVQADGMEGTSASAKLTNATTQLSNMIAAAPANKIDKND